MIVPSSAHIAFLLHTAAAAMDRALGGQRARSRLTRLCAALLPMLFVAACLSAAAPPTSPTSHSSADNPIVYENRLPGGRAWEPVSRRERTLPGVPHASAEATARRSQSQAVEEWERTPIDGYADRVSVEPGGTIELYVSTTAPRYDLLVHRMGWYDGAGAHQVHEAYAQPGREQPVPAPDPQTGMIAANWERSYSLTIPPEWPSGVYLVRLVANNEEKSIGYIVFVVRDDRQVADFVYQLPLNTYQAYNNWGGKSLYDHSSPGGRANKVSFDRPYAKWNGAGRFFDWDYPMIRWLEREGYDVTYTTDVDTHAGTTYLPGRRALIVAGHSEYWSREMRDTWEAARDAGTSLAFFSANTAYWQMRYEPSADGRPNRVVVCYKDVALDPLMVEDRSRVTVQWRNPVVGRPENALLGIMWDGQMPPFSDYPYIVKQANHWIFERTGAEPGQAWSRIVGYEYDKADNNGLTPPNLVVLSESPVADLSGRQSVSHSSYYQQGGMVFTAGTIDWAWALDDSRIAGHVDSRIQRVTANVLNAFRQGAPP
jgi:hypothetical protein